MHRFGNLDVKDLDGLKHLESILKAKADSTQDHRLQTLVQHKENSNVK